MIEGRPVTVHEARRHMLMWATGERSHTNMMQFHGGTTPEERAAQIAATAFADAAETQKWASVFTALRAEAIDG